MTCEVTPHHLLPLTRRPRRDWERFGRMNPPLRSEERRAAVFERVADGTVDMIATDHAPHTRDEKDASIWDAPSGVPGVETALPLLLEAARTGPVELRARARPDGREPGRYLRPARERAASRRAGTQTSCSSTPTCRARSVARPSTRKAAGRRSRAGAASSRSGRWSAATMVYERGEEANVRRAGRQKRAVRRVGSSRPPRQASREREARNSGPPRRSPLRSSRYRREVRLEGFDTPARENRPRPAEHAEPEDERADRERVRAGESRTPRVVSTSRRTADAAAERARRCRRGALERGAEFPGSHRLSRWLHASVDRGRLASRRPAG